jgi:nitrogen regulatory protein P-II 1
MVAAVATFQSAGFCTRHWIEMKLIEAYIPPDSLALVKEMLLRHGLDDMVASDTAVEASADDRSQWPSYTTDFIPQVKLEVAVTDEQATTTAHEIFNLLSKRREAPAVQILIGHLEQVVRIETGERGLAAVLGAQQASGKIL